MTKVFVKKSHLRLLRKVSPVFGISIINYISFCLFDWKSLRAYFAKILVIFFDLSGFEALVSGSDLTIQGVLFDIARECTYLDLFLITAPFMWQKKQIVMSMIRMCGLGFAIIIINLIRVYFAIKWYLNGVPWIYSHGLPYFLFYFLTILFAILCWKKSNELDFT